MDEISPLLATPAEVGHPHIGRGWASLCARHFIDRLKNDPGHDEERISGCPPPSLPLVISRPWKLGQFVGHRNQRSLGGKELPLRLVLEIKKLRHCRRHCGQPEIESATRREPDRPPHASWIICQHAHA